MRRQWLVPCHRVRQSVRQSTAHSSRSWSGTWRRVGSSSQRPVIVGRGHRRFPWDQVDPLATLSRALVTDCDGGGLDGERASGATPCGRRHLRSPRSASECRGAARARRRRFRRAGCLSLARLALAPHFLPTSVPPR